jgi:type I restriction enzyme S subunit
LGNRKIKIGDYCDVVKGGIGIKKAIKGKYPLVVTAEKRLSHNEFQFDCKAVLVPLVSSTGHGHASIKRIHYQEGQFALGTILSAIIIKDENIINPKFLHIYLSYFKDHLLVPLMKGAANVTLSIKKIKTVEIVLPSIERQLEIIELEKNNSLIDELNNEIDCQKQLLTKLKQSILQEAIQGKLTESWRKQNPTTEPASKLLKRIKAEKAQLIKEKKIKKEKPLPKITKEEIPFELPEGWVWCRMQSYLDVRDGTHNTPNYVKFGIPLVTSKNLYTGELKLTNVKYISEKDHKEISKRSNVEKGDVLLAMIGSIGNPVVVNVEPNFSIKNVALIKPYINSISHPNYIKFFLETATIKFINEARGGVQPFISLTKLRLTCFPLPPLSEQKEIVKKVDSLMQQCQVLEQEIKTSEANAKMLMQAVLKEAFESKENKPIKM